MARGMPARNRLGGFSRRPSLPAPPSEKATARENQTGQAGAHDGAGDANCRVSK